MHELKNISEAKKSLKHHIEFFEILIKHLDSHNTAFQVKAMLATWCLHQYINDGLIADIEKYAIEFMDKSSGLDSLAN